MQKELTKGKLLDEHGNLLMAGYSKTILREYNRKDIKAGKLRIKEWDYYIITNKDFGLALTIADNSYMSLVSASFLDYKAKTFTTTSEMKWFTNGKTNLPSSLEKGDIIYNSKRVKMEFYNDGVNRHLVCEFNKFRNEEKLSADIILSDNPSEYMVIATPFDKDKHFYYNSKVNCLKAQGNFTIGSQSYAFDKEDSLGTLDWGRGVWTYKNTWYWGSLQTYVEDENGNKIPFGFNIGYGFGNTSAASENMLFYNGKSHKLENVTFNIPSKDKEDSYLDDWTFTSSDNRLNLDFHPITDRKDCTNALIIASYQHQVFGIFDGYAILDDGKKVLIKQAIGFAEKVYNKW